jgi:leucyl aminopeptidase
MSVDQIHCADIARDYENEPANRMTPKIFSEHARKVNSKQKRVFKVTVLDEKEMAAQGFGLVMCIGTSSAHPPRFIAIESMSSSKEYPTVVLIGKGVTFDAGGLRLKPASSMLDMKEDKSGASVVLSIMKYVQTHKDDLKLNLIALMPMVENVINGRAVKPGDIVTALDGTSVEITDPDAEGRLIIADAMVYSQRYRPDYIFDFATLTNFASTVNCDMSAVFYTRNDELSRLVYAIGETCGERLWMHPPWSEYALNTTSSVADTKNAIFDCTRSGSFMAAMFISNFVPEACVDRWVHFDISNNTIRGIHSGNCALLGMRLILAIEEMGTKISHHVM